MKKLSTLKQNIYCARPVSDLEQSGLFCYAIPTFTDSEHSWNSTNTLGQNTILYMSYLVDKSYQLLLKFISSLFLFLGVARLKAVPMRLK